MKLEVNRHSIQIIPETPQDEAMLEDTFGLKSDGAQTVARRVNASGLNCWAYLEITKTPAPPMPKTAFPAG